MSILKLRRRYENVDLGGYYPEPWLVSGHPLRQFLYRALLGRPMDGKRWTDCSFWRSAQHGEPSWWLRLAGWQRMSIRLIGAYGTLIVLPALIVLIWPLERYGLAMSVLMLHALPVLIAMSIVLIRSRGLLIPWLSKVRRDEQSDERSRFYERWAWAPVRLVEGRHTWERDVVRPLAKAIAPQLPRAYHPKDAAEWCIVPRNYMDERGQPVEIRLPAGFTGADFRAKERLVRTITTRLAAKDMAATWELEQTASPRLLLSPLPAPPRMVGYADIAHLLQESEEFRPLLGIAAGGSGCRAEMIADSPHIGMSAGPGAGKTTLAAFVGAQVLSWGWEVVVLDWKQSEGWKPLLTCPNVRYITKLDEIHAFGESLLAEVDRRKTLGMDGRRKVLVIRDEWNATAELLMDYWREIGPEETEVRPLPRSPALRGFSQLDFCGREFNLFDFVIAQRFSAKVFNGNADIRECFQIRLLARYTPQTKMMLVGNMKPFPKKDNHPGRWVVVAGDDVSVVQVPLLTAEELRAVAAGRPAERPGAWGNRPNVHSTQGESLPHGVTPTVAPTAVLELEPAPVRAASLSSLAGQLQRYEVTKKILQHARDRDESFPKPVGGDEYSGYLYDVDQVTEYVRRRHARMAAERAGK